MTYEILYPSGHRQIWREAEMDGAEARFYECVTWTPEGDPVELRILSGRQLQRTMRRVLRSGGQVRVLNGKSSF